MKAAILEDENMNRDLLLRQLQDANIEIVGVFHSLSEFNHCVKKGQVPDLCFFDMDTTTFTDQSIDHAVSLNSFMVFMTTKDIDAWKYLRHERFDFLKKPFVAEDVQKIITHQKKVYRHNPHNVFPPVTERTPTGVRSYKSRLLIKLGDWYTSIETEEIAYVYTNEKLRYIRTFSNKDHLIDANLEELEQQLDPHQFHRVNRQFLVNFKALDKILAWFDGKIKITLNPPAHEDVIISRLKAGEFKRWLDE